MNTSIVILNAKGGVGKSTISVNVAAALLGRSVNFDNDSQTPTLSRYKNLKAEKIQIYDVEDGEIIPESLDITRLEPISQVLEQGSSEYIVVDNGSSSFHPFQGYFTKHAVEMFHEMLPEFDFICVIPVSSDEETQKSAIDILKRYGNSSKYIIINNEHFGKVDFTQTSYFEEFQKQNAAVAVLNMPRLQASFLKTHEDTRNKYLTYHEALKSKEFSLIEKSRVAKLKNDFEGVFLAILEDFKDEKSK